METQRAYSEVLERLHKLTPSFAQLTDTERASSSWYSVTGTRSVYEPQGAREDVSKVLGISCYYHDAAAALVVNGKVVAAVEEERFSRRKHDSTFPAHSIEFCLQSTGIKPEELDLIVFYEQPLLKLERVLACGKRWGGQSDELLHKQLSRSLHERLMIEPTVRQHLGYQGKFAVIPHHLSHAASAFYCSPYEEAAILTVDGVGEWSTTGHYIGKGTGIDLIREIHYPDSLGLLYSMLTAFLGFKVNNDEYKVMGLAGLGQPRHTDLVRELINTYPDGSYRLNLDYFSFMYDERCMFTEKTIELLGSPRLEGAPLSAYHQDLAASLQHVLEDTLVNMVCNLHELGGHSGNLCMAGGVALNGVANWRIFEDTPFESVWVQPAAGDAGGAVGAALYGYHTSNRGDRIADTAYSTLLGPEYSDAEIETELIAQHVTYQAYSRAEILERAAQLIMQNQIVGWFQGRVEFGPRALGCRSILANACNSSMQDILNRRVKFREDFRPFAPAVMAERAEEYFDLPFDSPYMLFVCPVLPEKVTIIPSVTHTDGTARVQTVARTDNPIFYELLEAVDRASGVPIVINTSFNIRGEPIVCTPGDAIRCFNSTDIDYLVIGNFIAEKLF